MPYNEWWLNWLVIVVLTGLAIWIAVRRRHMPFMAVAVTPAAVAVAIAYVALKCWLPELDLFPADLKPPFPKKSQCPANATTLGWSAVVAGYVVVVAVAVASWLLEPPRRGAEVEEQRAASRKATVDQSDE
ncbi:MAG: hypothetical protein QNJ88_07860 [Acidimicrobiia bacterium]|nr:hypothetical protein [Acidimicrobiia bacterium]